MKKLLITLFFVAGITCLKAQSLAGKVWMLKNVDNIEAGKSRAIEENIKFSLVFDSDSIYSGDACRHYKGNYKASNGKNISMQKAEALSDPNCLGLANLQKEVLDLLILANRYRIVDNTRLFIFTSDDHRLIFQKK